MISDFCIHLHVFLGNRYEPSDSWCDLDCDENCGEECPRRYSKDDYFLDEADREYERYE